MLLTLGRSRLSGAGQIGGRTSGTGRLGAGGARRALSRARGTRALLQVVALAARALDCGGLAMGRPEGQRLVGAELRVLAAPATEPPGHGDSADDERRADADADEGCRRH